MKLGSLIAISAVFAAYTPGCVAETSPISKVLQMLADLEKKTLAEGEVAAAAYEAFKKKCTSGAQEFGFQIKTSQTEIEELTATITKETSSITALTSKIEEISASISKAEGELKSAFTIRTKEAADFSAEEKELSQVIDALNRAISILSKELSSGASLLQVKNAGSLTQALTVMVEASMLSTADASRLTALAQVSQEVDDTDEEDEELGAPASSVYQSKSGGIVSTLEDLLEKAEAQLEKARKEETDAIFNFKSLEQSLKDEISYSETDMSRAKKAKSKSKELKSAAEGDLSVSKKDLKSTKETLSILERDCMTEAEEHEEETKSRAEELKVLKEATKIIREATSFVSEDSTPASFIQQILSSRLDTSNADAVHFVRSLARKHHSAMLAQLASRMGSVMRLGSLGGADPFAKVKGLIKDMVQKLEDEAEEEAGHKEYCDKNLAEGTGKKADLESAIKDLTTSMDQSTAKAASLKAQIAELEKELAANSKLLAEEGLLRTENHKTYVENKEETEKGIKGIQLALKVLKEYYAKADKSDNAGAASGIISLLEVCESDLSKSLAEMTSTEESEASEYEKLVKQIQLAQTSKGQDVKYKTKEAASLAKAATDLSADLDGKQSELDAALQFLGELTKECAAKVDPYEERKARREAELAGLKEAMEILSSQTMFLQRSVRRSLRGVRPHHP
mmetsp:Transcript_130128/g.239245  ORF Transcript_130128/g.239245 Transcript_130128/m.239245 type:complete len:685 (+) Transcript_130128:77-2131(+)